MNNGLHRAYLLVLIALCLAPRVQCQDSQRVELFRHPGTLWLSWSSVEREAYVYGYLDGYAHGMNEACLAADKLFETDKVHLVGHDEVPSTFPSARCRASVAQFKTVKIDPSSGPDFSTLTNVITEFYTKHPEYRNVTFTRLMQYLSGTRVPTADELYAEFVGHHHTPE